MLTSQAASNLAATSAVPEQGKQAERFPIPQHSRRHIESLSGFSDAHKR